MNKIIVTGFHVGFRNCQPWIPDDDLPIIVILWSVVCFLCARHGEGVLNSLSGLIVKRRYDGNLIFKRIWLKQMRIVKKPVQWIACLLNPSDNRNWHVAQLISRSYRINWYFPDRRACSPSWFRPWRPCCLSFRHYYHCVYSIVLVCPSRLGSRIGGVILFTRGVQTCCRGSVFSLWGPFNIACCSSDWSPLVSTAKATV